MAGTRHREERDGCLTCGDIAVEMTVERADADRGLALCSDAAGNRETVETALVPAVASGDRLLVHAGTAILRLDDRPGGEAGAP